MGSDVVIARAYRGEALRRVALSTGKGLVYVAAEGALEAVLEGIVPPVGFPVQDVFRFEAGAFDDLALQWSRDGRTDPATWNRLSPYAI